MDEHSEGKREFMRVRERERLVNRERERDQREQKRREGACVRGRQLYVYRSQWTAERERDSLV